MSEIEQIRKELEAKGYVWDEIDLYDPIEVFLESPTLIKMAVERLRDELRDVEANPENYIAGRELLVTLDIDEFMERFFERIRRV